MGGVIKCLVRRRSVLFAIVEVGTHLDLELIAGRKDGRRARSTTNV